jgi:hypothetical protein
MTNTPPLSLFDDPRARQSGSFPRPGKGVEAAVNMMGSAFAVRSNAQVFNHPWKPALGGGLLSLQRGTVTMADGVYEPLIDGTPVSGPPPEAAPTLYLDPSIPAGGTESWVCLQLELAALTTGSASAPPKLAKPATNPGTGVLNSDSCTIVHLLNPVSQQVALALCPLVLITWQAGQPFQAIEGVYFNLVYTRVVPGPGGGPVQHFFT